MIEIKNLEVYFGRAHAVKDVTFTIKEGEIVAIVGPSGCGKSSIAKALSRLHTRALLKGKVLLNGIDLLSLDEKAMRKVRAHEIGMIFQDPMSSLNPTMPVGKQIREANPKKSLSDVKELLQRVGIENAEKRLSDYPHQFSGGERQRIMIAIAVICEPKLLIADEPTTALDVTIQAEILRLIKSLGITTLFITHNLAILPGFADRIIQMKEGEIE